jgi:hypothetical protein
VDVGRVVVAVVALGVAGEHAGVGVVAVVTRRRVAGRGVTRRDRRAGAVSVAVAVREPVGAGVGVGVGVGVRVRVGVGVRVGVRVRVRVGRPLAVPCTGHRSSHHFVTRRRRE